MPTQDPQAVLAANRALTVALPGGQTIPRLGQGTWYMGERRADEAQEIKALRTGIELGMTLIDTAEMYGSGLAEALIKKAIAGLARERLTIVSKVYPHNAGRGRIETSCENSLRRMGIDYIDVYLLHWRGQIPLSETAACMEALKKSGKIRAWGVSNLDIDDMQELWQTPGGDGCSVNQVLYHLGSRGVEVALLPWLRAHNVPMMAYCPLAQGGSLRRGLLSHPAVRSVAAAHDATPAQVLLAFLLADENVIAIPKSSSPEHTRENAEAACIRLSEAERRELSAAFPAPARKVPLDIM